MTYIRRQLKLSVYRLISRGGRDARFENVDGLSEVSLANHVIAMPAIDVDLIQGTTISVAKILYIETDTEILVKLATVGDTGFVVKPLDGNDVTSGKKGSLYLEGEFTGLFVTPAGSVGDATVLVALVGA